LGTKAEIPALYRREAMPQDNNGDGAGVLSNVVKLLPVYAVYVFIAGWTFFDYYFRYFGVSPKWLDIAFHDTLTKGFTILFGGGGLKLWLVYGLMLAVPLLAERKHNLIRRFLLISALVAILPLIYCISREVGINQAKIDKSSQSSLPTVSFIVNKHQYRGYLLFVRNGMYFVHNVDQKDESEVQEVSIFRAEEVSDIRIVEFK
jgi:hypothetical protein